MKVAIVAAEIGPYAKEGGLADVIAALPQALARRGAEPAVVVPAYRTLLRHLPARVVADRLELQMGARREPFRILAGDGPNGFPIYLIDHPEFFGREGIYSEAGREYSDNLRRYIFFSRAAALAVADIVHADLVHAHDWHAALTVIAMRADDALRPRFAATASAFTIHNLAYQGILESLDYTMLGLDWSWYSVECLEFWGKVNLVKGAVALADGVSTVSPSYAREVVHDPDFGFGLEGVLAARGDGFVGILNGAAYDEWDPAHDRLIPKPYSPRNRANKKHCLDVLRDELDLPHPPKSQPIPMIGMISRMTEQKGFDILAEALDAVMALDVQLVMLANGDAELEKTFKAAEQRYPDRMRVIVGFDNRVAHRIQAGANLFLMPSRFEPCGLTQMYALRYGTAPIVRATGGLRDTVSEFNYAARTGNGFVFSDYTAEALAAAVTRAVAVFHKPAQWQMVMRNCFGSDFSWDRAAGEYLQWFERLRRERASA